MTRSVQEPRSSAPTRTDLVRLERSAWVAIALTPVAWVVEIRFLFLAIEGADGAAAALLLAWVASLAMPIVGIARGRRADRSVSRTGSAATAVAAVAVCVSVLVTGFMLIVFSFAWEVGSQL